MTFEIESNADERKPIGDRLDAIGIEATLGPDDLVSGAVVLLLVESADHGTMVKTLRSDGLSWVTQRGLMEVALQHEVDDISLINRSSRDSDD